MLSKNICVVKKSHPASIFSFKCPGSGETWTKAIVLRKGNSNKDWSGEYNRVGDISLPGTFSDKLSITGWSNTSYIWSTYVASTWTLVGEPATLFGETWTPDKIENDLVYEGEGVSFDVVARHIFPVAYVFLIVFHIYFQNFRFIIELYYGV